MRDPIPETLVCDVVPRLDAVSAEEWRRLFPDLPDSLDMLQLIQRSGPEGFRFHSIVVREGDRPILLLPLFETTYELSTLMEPGIQPVVAAAAKRLPRLLSPRLLGVGFVEAEWGQVGIDFSVDRATLAAAWRFALEALQALADGLKADLIAFVNFTAESGRMLPMEQLNGFSRLSGLPFAQTEIAWSTTDAYLADLSKKMRNNLRRYLRKAQQVSVLRTREPGPWLEAIYQLYLDTYRRSNVHFSLHSREFFSAVCRRINEAEYVLYFIEDRLAAFQLQVVTPTCLIDKYFGMDQEIGRAHSLYFVSWVKDIEYCISKGIPVYHAGLTEEETKARLGAEFIPSLILFRHRHPVLHRLLTKLAAHLAYRPAVALPPMELGSAWGIPQELGGRSRSSWGVEQIVRGGEPA